MAFKKATKSQAKLRLAISGPSGSGKTYTALAVGKHLGSNLAVIDTERGSASKYAGDVADFDVDELTDFSVQQYLRSMDEAARNGADVLIIDSMTHAWNGKGGILEEVDKRGGKFEAWKHASPLHARFIDAILNYPGHVIVTMRSKMDYLVSTTDRGGRKETKIEKVGLAPVQRDDVSYEFDVWLEMNDRHHANVSKTRCRAIDGSVIEFPGKDLADTLRAWLSDGAPVQERARPLVEGRTPTTSATPTTTGTSAGRPASTATTKPTLDEYGLEVPGTPCPVFTKDGPNKGKRWDEVSGAFIEKLVADYGNNMSAAQVEWGMYIATRRQARKAKEAREAEAAAVTGDEHGDPEPPVEAAQ
jgi:hypothetical protein